MAVLRALRASPFPADTVERSITEYSVTLDAAGVPTVVEELRQVFPAARAGFFPFWHKARPLLSKRLPLAKATA
jgi:hypothetical protein